MVKYDYDSENDILSVNLSSVKESIELIDGFYIDLNSSKSIVGIEILFASEILSKMSSGKINKEFLSNLHNISFNVIKYKSSFILKLSFESKLSKEDLSVPVYDLFASSKAVSI